jgi:hypothetical protein
LLQLLRILPDLQAALDDHNEVHECPRVELFVGVVLLAPEQKELSSELHAKIERAITAFNATGLLSHEL